MVLKFYVFRPIRRFLTLDRLRMVRSKFDQYGNRVLFVARFLPGLRAPIYMVAGITRRVSFTRFCIIRFLCCDYFRANLGLSR